MKTLKAYSRSDGFTLIELLVVVAIAALLMAISIPTLQNFIHRGKLEGVARQTATLMRLARLEAIKRSRPAVVTIDVDRREVVAFADPDDDGVHDAGEREIGRYLLPEKVQIGEVAGFPAPDHLAQFDRDGSVRVPGAFRFEDVRGNRLEVNVAPAATARIEIRKWQDSQWVAQGEGGKSWTWN